MQSNDMIYKGSHSHNHRRILIAPSLYIVHEFYFQHKFKMGSMLVYAISEKTDERVINFQMLSYLIGRTTSERGLE